MGKLEEDPPEHRISPHYMPWHGHVTALTVAPSWRRMGLAKKLTTALEKQCEAQNAWFIDLFVRKSNAAVNMYKGMGYEPIIGHVHELPNVETDRRADIVCSDVWSTTTAMIPLTAVVAKMHMTCANLSSETRRGNTFGRMAKISPSCLRTSTTASYQTISRDQSHRRAWSARLYQSNRWLNGRNICGQ